MATRNTRYWRHFLHNLLAPIDEYDGVSFFTAIGRVEYRDGCFQDGSLDVDPLQILAIFEQLTRQAIQKESGKPTTAALRLGDCVLHVVSASFSSVCAVSSGKSRSLVVEKLPFGVLLVAFSAPAQLQSVFGRVDRACAALRR